MDANRILTMGKYQNVNVLAIMIERFAALAMAPPHGTHSHPRGRSLIVAPLIARDGILALAHVQTRA